MDISIVIVSYNVRPFLEKCLDSVFKSSGNFQLEVIIVDNNSIDDSVSHVRAHFPQVKLIAKNKNLGFSKANNIGFEVATGKYVLILNPDTVLNEDTISTCVEFMESHDDAGMIGVKMLDGTGTYLPESKRGLPSPLSSFFKLTNLNRLFPKSNFFNGYYLGGLDPESSHKVPVLTGAFMFTQKTLLDEVGGFDEDYFMYGEDIDLCYKILKTGAEIYYVPQTSIIHYKGESTKRSSLEYVRTFYSAMLIFVTKHYSGPKGVLLKQFLRLGIFVRALLSGLHRFVSRLFLPILDVVMIVLICQGVKYFWARWVFNSPNHFQESFGEINLPIYGSVWVLSLAFFGAYDKGRSSKRIAGGLALGTALILIVYALLPEELRSSRAIILISALLIFIVLTIITALVRGVNKTRNISRVAVVGKEGEAERIMELLNRVDPDVFLVGAISIERNIHNEKFIATIDSLPDVVKEYRIDQLIFSSGDIGFGEISHWMAQLGPAVNYKIAGRESNDIVGSNSKTTAGSMYTSKIEFTIDDSLHRRNKRLFDITSALFILILSFPINIFSSQGRKKLNNAKSVLLGQSTWVGYDVRDSGISDLPIIRQGVLSPAGYLRGREYGDDEIRTIDYLYAREYSLWSDIQILSNASKYVQRVES